MTLLLPPPPRLRAGIIDEEKKVRHSKLAEKTDDVITNPQKINVKLKVGGSGGLGWCFHGAGWLNDAVWGQIRYLVIWLLRCRSRTWWTLRTPPSSSRAASTT